MGPTMMAEKLDAAPRMNWINVMKAPRWCTKNRSPIIETTRDSKADLVDSQHGLTGAHVLNLHRATLNDAAGHEALVAIRGTADDSSE